MLLCSGYRKSIDVILIPILISIDGSKFLICHNLIRQNRTTCIVYQYFKELFFECFSFRKADAKIETFRHYFQMFSEVFLFFFFRSLLKRKEKEKTGSFHTANHPHHVNHSALLLLQSGCKSRAFYNTNKIYDTFFSKKMKRFL